MEMSNTTILAYLCVTGCAALDDPTSGPSRKVIIICIYRRCFGTAIKALSHSLYSLTFVSCFVICLSLKLQNGTEIARSVDLAGKRPRHYRSFNSIV
jgi:hypothetical protein